MFAIDIDRFVQNAARTVARERFGDAFELPRQPIVVRVQLANEVVRALNPRVFVRKFSILPKRSAICHSKANRDLKIP